MAEHLDHLHYLNDILCLNIDALNAVLTDHLLNRLFIPLYIFSLGRASGASSAQLGQLQVSGNSCLLSLIYMRPKSRHHRGGASLDYHDRVSHCRT